MTYSTRDIFSTIDSTSMSVNRSNSHLAFFLAACHANPDPKQKNEHIHTGKHLFAPSK